MMKYIVSMGILILGTTILYAQSPEHGKLQLYYERYQSAENTFHQVLKTDAANGKGWYALTKAYLLQGEVEQAYDSIQLAPESVRDNPYYKTAYGAILLQQGKQNEAAAYFGQAIKQTKEKDPDILSSIAWSHIYADAGDGNYAVDLLNKAIKRNKHNPVLYVQLGDAWRKVGNSTEGYQAYHKAIEYEGKYALAYHRMGEIFLTQKNAEMYTDYFKRAVDADSLFAPSLYKLYVFEFARHPDKAMQYYRSYLKNADLSVQNEYDMTDLLYLNKQYDLAISNAKAILAKEGDSARPRLYKLIGYSLAASNDTVGAISYMQQYFRSEADSNFISKDYEITADLYAALKGKEDSAMFYYESAVNLEQNRETLYNYYKKLGNLAKERKDYVSQAIWLGRYYSDNEKATNLDLFNWGIALYRTENYQLADSVFGVYTVKFPEQTFGYYWQARSKSLQDKEMKEGLAIPAYEKLVEVLQKDTLNANYKKWIIEAYGYLATYQANAEKDYDEAIEYFQQILQLDPDNETVKKNVEMLEKELTANGSK